VPVVPSCLLEPAWVEFCALLDERRGGQPPEFQPGHPLGCHRRKVPGRVVFEHVVAALVHGSGYERIATPGCPERTIRRRLAEWAELGLGAALHAAALRGKGGLKRSVATEGYGIPLGIASAPGNRHDSPLLAPTLQAASRQLDGILPSDRTCHLDRGYDSTITRQLLDELGFDGQIARKGVPAPIQAGTRWVVERTHSWMNGYGKLRRCTEQNSKIVDFCLYLAAALVTIRQLIQRARDRYRWDTRPTTKRLKLRLLPGALKLLAVQPGRRDITDPVDPGHRPSANWLTVSARV
jgi:hypothetical protein